MPRKLTSAKARMWAGYNRRRANLSRKRRGFRVTVECLDDGARASFLTPQTPFGLTISQSNAGRKVACVLRNYKPLTKSY